MLASAQPVVLQRLDRSDQVEKLSVGSAVLYITLLYGKFRNGRETTTTADRTGKRK